MSTLKRRSSKEANSEKSNCSFAHFPEIIDERIDTNDFINASRDVVKLIDKFGKLFAPVKYDMQGNIDKLNAKYLNDKEIHATLQDMILLEVAMGNSTIATDALLWLTRSLHMIQLFFDKIVEDSKAPNGTEDLVAMLKKSYEESLEHYHGWMAKQLFGLLSRMVPSRTYMVQALGSDLSDKEDNALDGIDHFTKRLKKNVTALHKFYAEYGLYNIRN